MTGKKRTAGSAEKEIQRLEKELQTVRKQKAAAVKNNNASALKKLQEHENKLRTQLLDVKAASLSALLSQPAPVEDRSKALLEVLEERLEVIENRLSAIEDRLENL